MQDDVMTPSRPYLLRGLYDWIVDNNCTPYLLVDAEYPDLVIPLDYVNDGKIVLNVLPSAVRDFSIDNNYISFSARFAGKAQEIFLPIGSVLAVYAKENGRGMFFEAEEIPHPTTSSAADWTGVEEVSDPTAPSLSEEPALSDEPVIPKPKPASKSNQKSHLKVVK